MRKRDLFYYVFENNEKDYIEITNLIIEIDGFDGVTDERELFLKDLYFRILFEIAFMENANYTDDEIRDVFKGLFSGNEIIELRERFSIVIDIIKEKLKKVEQSTGE